MSSTIHSETFHLTKKVKMFYGRPDAWGIVVRSITSSSKHFTSVATFGHKIAAACDDGTVSIYDSVTGVLRLSLSLADHVQAMVGSPDGSVLFCAHNTSSVTVWDMQTGGLIHTFVLTRNAKDIAVSVKGRYLACGLDGGSAEVWKIAKKIGGGAIWNGSPVAHFCWLEPEEQFVVSTGRLARIWDVVAGTILHSYTTEYPARHMAYSQKFNQLAIVATSAPDSRVTIINFQTGTATTSPKINQSFSDCAFSQTAEELVCGMETHGLQLFNVLERRFKRTEYPDTVTSVSPLQNGTVVVNSTGSGIQLLSLDEGHIPSQQPTISALAVRSLDQGCIIAVVPTSRDHIIFLDLATMSQLSKTPVRNTGPNDHTTLLCASHKSHEAVYSFTKGGRGFLQLWRFDEEVPRWTVEVDGVPKIGEISPFATRLATFHDTNNQTRVFVWKTENGELDTQLNTILPPLDIGFTSDGKFCLHYHNRDEFYTITYSGLMPVLGTIRQLPSKWPQKRGYLGVDDTHEWIVSGSERICWIPPGYIGSAQSSYCWVGSSLVMVGQDGFLRKLTFSELFGMDLYS